MVVPPSDMHQHFERMLKDGRGADVAFNVDGQLFRAHRCVLVKFVTGWSCLDEICNIQCKILLTAV